MVTLLTIWLTLTLVFFVISLAIYVGAKFDDRDEETANKARAHMVLSFIWPLYLMSLGAEYLVKKYVIRA